MQSGYPTRMHPGLGAQMGAPGYGYVATDPSAGVTSGYHSDVMPQLHHQMSQVPPPMLPQASVAPGMIAGMPPGPPMVPPTGYYGGQMSYQPTQPGVVQPGQPPQFMAMPSMAPNAMMMSPSGLAQSYESMTPVQPQRLLSMAALNAPMDHLSENQLFTSSTTQPIPTNAPQGGHQAGSQATGETAGTGAGTGTGTGSGAGIGAGAGSSQALSSIAGAPVGQSSGGGGQDPNEIIMQLRRLNNDLSIQLALRENRIQELQEQSAAGRLQQQLQANLEQLRSQKKIIDEYEAKAHREKQLMAQIEELNANVRSLTQKLDSEREAHEAATAELKQKCEEQAADIEVLENSLAEQFAATRLAQEELKQVATQNTLLQKALDAERAENARLARASGVDVLQTRLEEVTRLLKAANDENASLNEQLRAATTALQESRNNANMLTQQLAQGQARASEEALLQLAQRTEENTKLRQQLQEAHNLIENMRKQIAQTEYDLLAVRDRLADNEIMHNQRYDGFGGDSGSDALRELRRLRIVLRERDVQIATLTTNQTKLTKTLTACKFENDDLRKKLGMPVGDNVIPAWDEDRVELELNVQLQSAKALILKQEKQINRLERERLELLKELREGAITDARGFFEFLGLTAEQTELVKAYAQNVLEGEPDKLPAAVQPTTTETAQSQRHGAFDKFAPMSLTAAQEEITRLKSEVQTWKLNHASALVAKDQLEDRLRAIEAEKNDKFEAILQAIRNMQSESAQHRTASTVALESLVRAELTKSGRPISRSYSRTNGEQAVATRGIALAQQFTGHETKEDGETKEVLPNEQPTAAQQQSYGSKPRQNGAYEVEAILAALPTEATPDQLRGRLEGLAHELLGRERELNELHVVFSELQLSYQKLAVQHQKLHSEFILDRQRANEIIANAQLAKASAEDMRDAIQSAAVRLGVDINALKESGIFVFESGPSSVPDQQNAENGSAGEHPRLYPFVDSRHKFSDLGNGATDESNDASDLEAIVSASALDKYTRDDLIKEIVLMALDARVSRRREKRLQVQLSLTEERLDACAKVSAEQDHVLRIRLAELEKARAIAEARCSTLAAALTDSVPLHEALNLRHRAYVARERELVALADAAKAQALASRTRLAEASLQERERELAEAQDLLAAKQDRIAKLEAHLSGAAKGTAAALAAANAALQEECDILKKRVQRLESAIAQEQARAREAELETDVLSDRIKGLGATLSAERSELASLKLKLEGAITAEEAKKLEEAATSAKLRIAELEAELAEARERAAAATAYVERILEQPFLEALREAELQLARKASSGPDAVADETAIIMHPLLNELLTLRQAVNVSAELSAQGGELAALQQKLVQAVVARSESERRRQEVEETLCRCEAELLKLRQVHSDTQAAIAAQALQARLRIGSQFSADYQRAQSDYNDTGRRLQELVAENVRLGNRADASDKSAMEARERLVALQSQVEQLQAEVAHYKELVETLRSDASSSTSNESVNSPESETKIRSKLLEWGERIRAAKVCQLELEHRIRLLESELKASQAAAKENERALRTSQQRVVELETSLEAANTEQLRLTRTVEKLTAQAGLQQALERLGSNETQSQGPPAASDSVQEDQGLTQATRGVKLPSLAQSTTATDAKRTSPLNFDGDAAVQRALQQMKADMEEGQKVIEQQTEHLRLLASELAEARREVERVKSQAAAEIELAEATKVQAIQSLKRALVAAESQLEAKTQSAESYKEMLVRQREKFEVQRKADQAEIDRLNDLLYQRGNGADTRGSAGLSALEQLQAYMKNIPKLPEGVMPIEDVERIVSERDVLIKDLVAQLDDLRQRLATGDHARDAETEAKLVAAIEETEKAKRRVAELESQLEAATRVDGSEQAIRLKEVVEQMRKALKSKDLRLQQLASTISELQKRLAEAGIPVPSTAEAALNPEVAINSTGSSSVPPSGTQAAGVPSVSASVSQDDTSRALVILKESVQQYAERVEGLEEELRNKRAALTSANNALENLKRSKADDEAHIKELDAKILKLESDKARLKNLLAKAQQREHAAATTTTQGEAVPEHQPLGSAFAPENNYLLRLRALTLENRRLKQELKGKGDAKATGPPASEAGPEQAVSSATPGSQELAEQLAQLQKQVERQRAKITEQRADIERLSKELAKCQEEKAVLTKEKNDLTAKLRIRRPGSAAVGPAPESGISELRQQLDAKEQALLQSAQAQQRLLEEKTVAENNVLDLVQTIEACRHREMSLVAEIERLRKTLDDKEKELIVANTQALMSAKSAAALTKSNAEGKEPGSPEVQLAEAAEAAEVQRVAQTQLVAQLEAIAERERQAADKLQQHLLEAEHKLRAFALEQERRNQEVPVLERRLSELAQVVATYEAAIGSNNSAAEGKTDGSNPLEVAAQSLTKLVERQKREISSLKQEVERLQLLAYGHKIPSDPVAALKKAQEKLQEVEKERNTIQSELKQVTEKATQERTRLNRIIKETRESLRKEEDAMKTIKQQLADALERAEEAESKYERTKLELKRTSDENGQRASDAELMLQQEQHRTERLRAEVNLLRKNLESATQELSTLAEEKKTQEAELAKIIRLEQQLGAVGAEKARLEQIIAELQAKNTALQAELAMLDSEEFYAEVKQLRDRYVKVVEALQEADETIARYQQLGYPYVSSSGGVAPASNIHSLPTSAEGIVDRS